jgi:hypothetical protein
MSDGNPINTAGILSAHGTMYGAGKISLGYLKLVIRKLWDDGEIIKVSPGIYEIATGSYRGIRRAVKSTTKPDTVGDRVLRLMADGKPTKPGFILYYYKIVYGETSIGYLRWVIKELVIAGKVRKVARGVFARIV